MICLNIPLFIVSAFLVLTLVIGIYFSRQKTTFREYAVGDKRFATATLVATVLATLFTGGGMVRNVEQFYDKGIYWIVLLVLVSRLSTWIFSKVALRMGPFMHHLSIAESIGSIYGRKPRVITALFSICSSVIKVAVQIVIISRSIGICMDKVDPQIVTIFATLILIFYSTFGGVRAVALTDVFQLVTFTIIIPILAWFMFQATDKSTVDIFSFLQNQSRFQFTSLFQFDTKLVSMISLSFVVIVADFNSPAMIQRVYMSSDPFQASHVFRYTTLFGFCISSLTVLISLFVFAAAPNLSVTDIWGYIMLQIPSFFKGFLAITLLANSLINDNSFIPFVWKSITH